MCLSPGVGTPQKSIMLNCVFKLALCDVTGGSRSVKTLPVKWKLSGHPAIQTPAH